MTNDITVMCNKRGHDLNALDNLLKKHDLQ